MFQVFREGSVKLTKRTIDAAACPPGRKDVLLFDDELRGFALRVTKGGAKVFLFQYRAGGRVRRKVIGEYGTLTPAKARARAEELRGQILAGGDPVEEARQSRRAADAAREQDRYTVRVLLDEWQQAKQVERKGRSFAAARGALGKHLAAWLDRPARSITAHEAIAVLDAVAASGKLGATVFLRARAHAAFAWAVRKRKLAANPFGDVPAPVKAGVRSRVLSDAELGEAWRAAGALGWPYGPYLRVLILTLQRREEVADMRWSELSRDGRRWTVPAGRAKNGKAHVVHLAPAAVEILSKLPRFPECDFVFTTTGTGSINGYARAAERLRAAILEERTKRGAAAIAEHGSAPPPLDWVWHDFRRTGVTALAAAGVAPHVADKLLNHQEGTISGVAAIYQRHEFLPERERALATWARFVQAAAEGADPLQASAPNVVEIARARGRTRRGQ